MKRTTTACVLALVPAAAGAHDMFLVLADHRLPASSPVTVALYNGTFDRSENTIDRERMVDVSVVDGAGRRTHPGVEQWREEEAVTLLDLRVGDPGTYLVGVSTRARLIELSAAEFNEYLEHDGVLDVLAARRREARADRDAVERYSKHVKTLLQVGDGTTGTWSYRLGYPIELVPLANPAALSAGDTLGVLVLADGEPVPGQLIYASYAGYGGGEATGAHREAVRARTDDAGVARIELARPGRWYVRLIRMLPAAEDGVDYESNWATLTFQID